MQLTNTVTYTLLLATLAFLWICFYVARRSRRGSERGASAKPQTTPVAAVPTGHRLELQHDDGFTVMTIERATRSWAKAHRDNGLVLSAENEPWLQDVVQTAGRVLRAGVLGNLARTGVYRVTISAPGELMRARGGGLRGVVVDARGTVTGHATLHSLTTVARVAAIWEAAAFITAQKYLVDIFKTLKSIEGGIAQIQRWLSNERLASLQANSKILEEIEAGLSSNDRFLAESTYYQSALADVERDCSKIVRACLLDTQGYIDDSSKLELSGWVGVNPESLYEQIPKVTSSFDSAGFALVIRAYNTGLLSLLTSEQKIRDLRIKEIREMSEELCQKFTAFENAVEDRIRNLDSRLRREKKVEEKRNAIRTKVSQALTATKTRVQALPSAIYSLSTAVERLGDLSAHPLTLSVRIDDADQIRCRLLGEPAA